MTNSIQLFSAEIKISTILKRMFIGALIGFLIISFFVFGVDNPNPLWPENWRIRPLIITPIAGSFGVLSFYLSDILGTKNKRVRIFLFFVSSILFLISLWLGTVLGLAGTMWN
jgi:uncharacterized membrane protein YciS (DUF1049 family)